MSQLRYILSFSALNKAKLWTYVAGAINGPRGPRPHTVTSISGGVINATFTYDAKGNRTSGNGLNANYTGYDKANCMERGTQGLLLLHGPEHQRIAHMRYNGGTAYSTTWWYVEGPGGILSEHLSDATGYQDPTYHQSHDDSGVSCRFGRVYDPDASAFPRNDSTGGKERCDMPRTPLNNFLSHSQLSR